MGVQITTGILSSIPGPTQVIEGIENHTFNFLSKGFDFLDDSRMKPQPQWFTTNPSDYIDSEDWEDLATQYRMWREQFQSLEAGYWMSKYRRRPMDYSNVVINPKVGDAKYNEYLRFTFPGPEYSFNFPFPNPTGSEHYSFYNSSYPLKVNKVKFDISVRDAALAYSDDLLGLIGITLPDPDNYVNLIRESANRELTEEEIAQLEIYRQDRVERFTSASYVDMWTDENLLSIYYGQDPGIIVPSATSFGEMQDINRLSYVEYVKDLPSTGNLGDLIWVKESNENLIWNSQNNRWEGLPGWIEDLLLGTILDRGVEKKGAKRQLELCIRPFTWAAFHLPSYKITVNGGGDLII